MKGTDKGTRLTEGSRDRRVEPGVWTGAHNAVIAPEERMLSDDFSQVNKFGGLSLLQIKHPNIGYPTDYHRTTKPQRTERTYLLEARKTLILGLDQGSRIGVVAYDFQMKARELPEGHCTRREFAKLALYWWKILQDSTKPPAEPEIFPNLSCGNVECGRC